MRDCSRIQELVKRLLRPSILAVVVTPQGSFDEDADDGHARLIASVEHFT